jgi:hypothetical protein
MPVLCDITRTVGDAAKESATRSRWGGRESGEDSLLVFSVGGLNTTVPVLVNNVNLGSLSANPTQNHWYTQMVYLGGSRLKDRNNELQLESDVVCTNPDDGHQPTRTSWRSPRTCRWLP